MCKLYLNLHRNSLTAEEEELMAITQVGKHLMDLDVCTGKEGKGGLCYENTLIENTFLDPTTRNFLNT